MQVCADLPLTGANPGLPTADGRRDQGAADIRAWQAAVHGAVRKSLTVTESATGLTVTLYVRRTRKHANFSW